MRRRQLLRSSKKQTTNISKVTAESLQIKNNDPLLSNQADLSRKIHLSP